MKYNGNPAITLEGEALKHELSAAWDPTSHASSSGNFFTKHEPSILEHTRWYGENHGVSYRAEPLQVGSIVVGVTSEGEIEIAEGANWSPYRGAGKNCAEVNALAMARARFITNALAIYVVGPDLPDANSEINGLEALTLHPCATPCRNIISDHEATSSGTMIITNRAGTKYIERMTVAQMIDRYASIAPPPTTRQLALVNQT